jgi:hypothetical protein
MIEFTEYMLPHGRKRRMEIHRPEAIETMARDIVMREFRFETEILTTGQVSLTICDNGHDVAIKICENGPKVPETVDKLITDFHNRMMVEDLWANLEDAG